MNEIITNLCTGRLYKSTGFIPQNLFPAEKGRILLLQRKSQLDVKLEIQDYVLSKPTNYLIILELLLGERGHFVTHGQLFSLSSVLLQIRDGPLIFNVRYGVSFNAALQCHRPHATL